eukprot:506510_1
MLSQLEAATPAISSTLIAAVVTFVFYVFSLFSVYHRNQEYQKQKLTKDIHNNNKCEIKSKYPISAFMNTNDEKENINCNDIKKESESTKKCPITAFLSNDDKENINQPKVECPEETFMTDNDENIVENKKTEHFKKMGGMFNSNAIISSEKNKKKKKKPLPRVENLGCITLKELNQYTCNHETRQLISIFGTIYDVTAATDKYGKNGVYKEFAGHDITLCLGTGKLNEKWLDKFVQMEPKHKECAKGWIDFYHMQYPTAGILEKWSENTTKWPKLTSQELEELNAECIIM